MLKRLVFMLAATAVVAMPTATAFAAPHTSADGILPDAACHAAYPEQFQPVLCGRNTGGPGSAG
jgi:hypothetical protein